MPKGNGKDEEQVAGAEAAAEPGDQPAEGQQQNMPILGMIMADPNTGMLRIQYHSQAITDPVGFFMAVTQVALREAQTLHHKQQGPQIVRPNPPGIIKPPGVL